MNKYAQSAKNATTSDQLFKGKDILSMEKLIAAYPDGVLVTEFRKLNGKNGVFWLCGFAEEPAVCFSAPAALVKILERWTDEFGAGDVIAASNGLKADAGVKLKFFPDKTKDGKSFYNIEIIG